MVRGDHWCRQVLPCGGERHDLFLDSGVLNKKWDCSTGDLWGWTIYSHTIPNSPGQATLTGTVSYGTQKATMSVPVVIQ
jgi:hypothetical protein